MKLLLAVVSLLISGCVLQTPTDLMAKPVMAIYECDLDPAETLSVIAEETDSCGPGRVEYLDPNRSRVVSSFKNMFGDRVILTVAQVDPTPSGARILMWSEPRYSAWGPHTDSWWKCFSKKLDEKGVAHRVIQWGNGDLADSQTPEK